MRSKHADIESINSYLRKNLWLMALIEVKEYQKVCLQTCSFAHLWFFLITMDQLYLICRRKVLVKNPVLIVLFFVIISMHFMRRLERRPPKLLCIISWMWHGVAWHMYEPVWQRRSVKSIFMLVYMSCIRWNALMWFSCEGLSERSKLPLWQHPCICMFNFHFWNHSWSKFISYFSHGISDISLLNIN